MFSKLSLGQAHNLNRALRSFLNFAELKGYRTEWLNTLRKAIPKDIRGYDLKVPEEKQIIASIKKLDQAPLKYRALWNLLLDSGLRLTEACRLINQFETPVEFNNLGFYRVTLGYFRGAKLAFTAYFTKYTLNLIQQNSEKLNDRNATHYYGKYKYVAPKYIRKFVFDTMISEKFSIPESVADFIEGRTPKKIGARHYSKLLRQANGYYQRYAKYICKLRN
jgi:intergrase/recombinase